jgi:Putative glycosyl/glycerophosphate transferases involved in teichoic acid biosynthesis TagF/TagB/EpsJ/RodC
MKKVLKGLVKVIIEAVFRLFPLRNVIIFESHSDYCDNSRAIFEYMMGKGYKDKYKMVWLVEKPGLFKNKEENNVKFIQADAKSIFEKAVYCYYLSIARFAFYSHRTPLFKLNKGETFINLWHGTGLKNVNTCDLSKNFDYVLYSSDFYKSAYVKYLQCKPEHLLPLGNPRTDLMFMENDVTKRLGIEKYERTIIWMPTYRAHKNGYNGFSTKTGQPFLIPVVKDIIELEEINSLLAENKALLVIKLHPAQDISNFSFGQYSNIYFLTNEILDKKDVQLYTMLGATDALITDYSSVYVDYLLTGKPIGFTIDDMNEYKTGYIFEKPLEIMPGRHMKNLDDIKTFISDICLDRDEYLLKRKEINSKLNKYNDGHTSKRIVEFFKI